MIQIQDTILSTEIFDECFVCDYDRCKGICCVEGEGGAPLAKGESDIIRKLLPKLSPLLSPQALQLIANEDVSYIDEDGDEVTNIVNGQDCVLTTYDEEGKCQCAIERLYYAGQTDFVKPISCHLYPIRVTQYEDFAALNYHRWKICRDAVKLGKKCGSPIYRFLEQPLKRAFGSDWYTELCAAADLYQATKVKIPEQ